MDYLKAFETLKAALEKAAIPVPDGHFAIQVRLKDDDCAGIFYIEAKDKQLYIEPYDYYDHDVDILTSVKAFKSVIEGKLDIKDAIDSGEIAVSGYTEGFISFVASIPKKAEKKPAAKKATAKKTAAKADKPAKKTAEKKTAAKKEAAAKKTTAKAAKKETEAVKVAENTKKNETKETIAEVVKKEIKPAKKPTKK